MAGSSLLALIDDIASILDDVAAMTKVAAKKTSGVLGDDLALNAEQVSGVDASREIPVVLTVAKGSFINKVILVPCALLLSAFLPIVIQPLLVLGGLFLCFEGFEKVFEKLFHQESSNDASSIRSQVATSQTPNPAATMPQNPSSSVSLSPSEKQDLERTKIKGAIRTDFILSAEIIVISLGTVSERTLSEQASVLSLISILMTFGVYGLVGAIVKLDDLGLHLLHQSSLFKKSLGRGLLLFAPRLMKSLGVIGTIAMFLVGGSLVTHALPFFHSLSANLHPIAVTGIEGLVGVIAGALVMAGVHSFQNFRKKTN